MHRPVVHTFSSYLGGPGSGSNNCPILAMLRFIMILLSNCSQILGL